MLQLRVGDPVIDPNPTVNVGPTTEQGNMGVQSTGMQNQSSQQQYRQALLKFHLGTIPGFSATSGDSIPTTFNATPPVEHTNTTASMPNGDPTQPGPP
ncbi:hypothetical protein VKT23_014984 [Stygiomarasmius scandens]|uniref:Uncharacterized protein n=1 Tax=Marasmiellus scandens TaxID=2682957 RepID=A0ABR1J1B5_9AGAR